MIIRKPYAFFIKNFRKIHIALLVLCLGIIFKQSQVARFINEFMEMQTYDSGNFPITRYIPGYLLLLILVVLVGSILMAIVLNRKKKPWKLYLIPIITYSLMLLFDIIIRAYFQTYNGTETLTEISVYRDVLFFASIGQYAVIIVFLIRILGLDIRKFDFQSDSEFLELEEDDQAEIEININIDKESIKRGTKRVLRHLNYFYQEHKKICLIILGIIGIIILRKGYIAIFVKSKVYNQNEEYHIDGYTFTINNSYYTNKNKTGDELSSKSSFIIVDVQIRNDDETQREVNLDNFHILNGISNYAYTSHTYETEFEDLGNVYANKKLVKDKPINVIMIFKVAKDLDKKRFVLCYQEKGAELKLRQIKLKLEDLSEIKEHNVKLGDTMKVNLGGLKEEISPDDALLYEKVKYKYRECVADSCETITDEIVADQDEKILLIEYGTDEIESKELIDFSTKYGKIIYIDNKDKTKTMPMKTALDKTNKGKNFYMSVPAEIESAKEAYLEYTVRNNRYRYKLEI